MATREILSLDESTPQILAPQTGDSYLAPRTVTIQPEANTDGLVVNSGTLTADAQALDLTQTWNAGGVTFTSLKLNVTNTASNAASKLLDLQTGGTSRFSVGSDTSNPGLTITNASAATLFSVSNSTIVGNRTLQLTPSTNTTGLTVSSGTLTADAPAINVTQTWNASGVTFTGLKFNATDTASASGSLLMDLQVGGTNRFSVSKTGLATFGGAITAPDGTGAAPAYTFSSDVDTGFYWLSSGVIGVTSNGNLRATFNGANITLGSTGAFYWTETNASAAASLTLSRKAAANLQLGAADAAAPVAQTFGVQSVVAGTSNTAGANFTIRGSQGTGTGAGGDLIFQVAPAGASGTAQNALSTAFTIASTGSATFTGALTINGNVIAAGDRYYFGSSGNKGRIQGASSGVFTLLDGAGTNFNRLQFGGTTSSFPALKRSSTSLIVRLADDSANAPLESASLKTDAPAGGTAAEWKLGAVATVSPTSPNRTIEVDIGGTIYYLHAKTTND